MSFDQWFDKQAKRLPISLKSLTRVMLFFVTVFFAYFAVEEMYAAAFVALVVVWQVISSKKLKPVPKYSMPRKNKPIYAAIPVYNDPFIDRVLFAIDESDYDGELTAVIVDDGSLSYVKAKVEEAKRRCSRLKIIYHRLEKNSGSKSAPLNEAIKIIRTMADRSDLVMILDSDTFVDSQAINNIVNYMDDNPSYAGAYGTILMCSEQEKPTLLEELQIVEHLEITEDAAYVQMGEDGKCRVMAGAFNVAYLSAFDDNQAGLMPQAAICEDMVWTWQGYCAGLKFGYAQNAVSFTIAQPTLKKLIKQRERWAMGAGEAVKISTLALFVPSMRLRNFNMRRFMSIYVCEVFRLTHKFAHVIFLITSPLHWLAFYTMQCLFASAICSKETDDRRIQWMKGAKVKPITITQRVRLMIFLIWMNFIETYGLILEFLNRPKSWGTR